MNGTWTSTPKAVVPLQGPDIQLLDVSCVSVDWCMAVGYVGFAPMLQIWDGTRWTVAMAPPTYPDEYGQATSVECGTPTSCVAVVGTYDPGPGSGGTYLYAWDGAWWHAVPPGLDVDGPFEDPAPYSCAPDGSCVVVIQSHEVTVEWDGIQFSTTPFSTSRPSAADDVNALDCLDSGSCVAALTTGLATWDGTAWSPGVGTGDSGYADLWPDGPSELACSSTTECIAVGDVALDQPVGGQWNGAGWTERDLPAGWTAVFDVSCAGAGSCLAVGSQDFQVAVAAWSGDTWYDAPDAGDQILAISCLPLRCLAVGPLADGVPRPAIYAWTNP